MKRREEGKGKVKKEDLKRKGRNGQKYAGIMKGRNQPERDIPYEDEKREIIDKNRN